MLIYINDNKKIWAHNPILTKQESQEHVNGVDCLWIDGLVIEYPPHEDNQTVEMYLNEDNTIRYEIIDATIESKTATLDDVKKDTESLQQDNLIAMGALAEQYEGQEVLKQDMLALMSALAELYEMVIGGSN